MGILVGTLEGSVVGVCDRDHGGLRPAGSRSLFFFCFYFCSRLYNGKNITCDQERPYHNDSTASRLLSEVKHCRARLVLRWGTTLESLVLFFCILFSQPAGLVALGSPTGGLIPFHF